MEFIESLFKLKDHKTSFKKEVLAGLATFLTMAYIMVVNPAILSETGMDFDSVFVATILLLAAYHKFHLVDQGEINPQKLRKSIRNEICIGVMILSITAMLSNVLGPASLA